jgi:SAM-dependent methyltransferase
MNIDNQTEYWNKVAEAKIFTHPLDKKIINKYLTPINLILDYGCGYGRTVKELVDLGYSNIIGFDTSNELINRGKNEHNLPLIHITNPLDLSVQDNSIDFILLFAVLTCIPSNNGQKDLINLIRNKLKTGGILYISDYYLQNNSLEMERYEYLNGDKNNYGVFSLTEGATFRHHTPEWISELTKDFKILLENPVEVMTMNGHSAKAFQLVIQK